MSRTAPPPARTKPPEVKQPTVEAGPGPAAPPPAAEAPAPDPAEKPRVEPSPAAPVTPPAPAGPEWEEYVRELKAVRKTAYALVRSGVAGRLDAGMFCLEFDNKAVTAFRYAQQAETAKALVAVAEKQFGGSVGVVLKRAASPDEAVLKPAAAATSRARPVPVEIVEDIVNEGEDAGRFESTVDPGTMEQIAEEMSGEIKADTEADRGGQPPTRQDFDSLFEPIDLDA